MAEFNRNRCNAMLHLLSRKICGSDMALRSMLEAQGHSSTLELTDAEAKEMQHQLSDALAKANASLNSISDSDNQMTLSQRSAIIRIARYEFYWTPQATFSYILGTCPHLRSQLSKHEIKISKLGALYQIMSLEDADKVIKRLDKIKDRNDEAN